MDFMGNFFNGRKTSKEVAKDRLKLVLVHDRINCSAKVLEMLKNDIIKVISNYLEIDDDSVEFQITHTSTEENENVPVLYANIPIRNMRKLSS
jgi:cell division topological specificity factor